MKFWLPVLLDNLPQSPVLALSSGRELARAALYNRQGRLLAGHLGSAVLTTQAAEEARSMQPGECRLLIQQGQISLECLAPGDKNARFWDSALASQKNSWASWLLTMPRLEEGTLKMTRHLLNAFNPLTAPSLPDTLPDYWSLLPLKSGLGRLFVLGDDGLALELSALAGRAGLATTWVTAREATGAELEKALLLGTFDYQFLKSWADLTSAKIAALGIKDGVSLVVTACLLPEQHDNLKNISTAYLAFTREAGSVNANTEGSELFSKAATATQKALSLINEMLN